MILDGGKTRGGFKANYEARIVPPVDTEILHAINTATGMNRSPNVEVEIARFDGKPWSVGFAGTLETISLLTTPNPDILGVAGPDGHPAPGFHIIDTRTRKVSILIDLPVECAASDISGGRLFLASCTDVTAYDGEKLVWSSRRISLDGVKMLMYADGFVRGIGIDIPDMEISFSIDAVTGEASGGFNRF